MIIGNHKSSETKESCYITPEDFVKLMCCREFQKLFRIKQDELRLFETAYDYMYKRITTSSILSEPHAPSSTNFSYILSEQLNVSVKTVHNVMKRIVRKFEQFDEDLEKIICVKCPNQVNQILGTCRIEWKKGAYISQMYYGNTSPQFTGARSNTTHIFINALYRYIIGKYKENNLLTPKLEDINTTLIHDVVIDDEGKFVKCLNK